MYKYIAFLSVIATTALSPIGVAHAETLQETVQQALSGHPSIEGALARKDLAIETKSEAKSGLYPVINAGTSAGYIYADNSTSRGLTVSRGSGSSGLWEANASLTQPLYNGKQTKNRIGAADARIQAADFNALDVKETLVLQATQAHIGVLQAQETLAKTQSYINTIDDYLERVQFMVDEGVADETELTQAQNISLMLKSSLLDYQGQYQTALANYNEVVGQVPRSALVKPNSLLSLPSDVQAAINQAKTTHPLALANKKEMEALGFDVRAEKGALHPDINAELSGIKREQKEVIGGELTDARALLTLNWDFETGGASKARQMQSQAQYDELVAQNEEQARVIEGDIRRAYAELATAQNQVSLVQQRQKVTQELFEAYKIQFEGARVRLLQLMQAENQVYNAQLESVVAEYRYLFAQHAVMASVGQLKNITSGVAVPVTNTKAAPPEISMVNVTPPRLKQPALAAKPQQVLQPVVQSAKPPIQRKSLPVSVAPRSPVSQPSTVQPQPTSSLRSAPSFSERIFIDTK